MFKQIVLKNFCQSDVNLKGWKFKGNSKLTLEIKEEFIMK